MTPSRPPTRTERRDLTVGSGRIAIWDRLAAGRTILLVHGNSATKAAFRDLFETARLAGHRLVAIDLPGCGESADAADPQRDYTIPAFARLVGTVIAQLALDRPVLLGWSLGGHIGIEAAAQGVDLSALILTGTPPAGPGLADIAETFHADEALSVGFSEDPGAAALDRYVALLYGNSRPVTAELRAAAHRCDGRMRRIFAEHWLSGVEGVPQRGFVAAWRTPVAVIQGDEEPFFDPALVDRMRWGNLWLGRGRIIAGAGHAPFFERPEEYAALVGDFLDHQERGRSARSD